MPRREDVLPLDQFPAEARERIELAVAQPWPPPKWLSIGPGQIQSRAWWEWHWQRGADPDKVRAPIPKDLRLSVYERDGHACLRCRATEDLTLDHIVHYSAGGADSFSNLRTLCRSCNSARQTKSDLEWLGADL